MTSKFRPVCCKRRLSILFKEIELKRLSESPDNGTQILHCPCISPVTSMGPDCSCSEDYPCMLGQWGPNPIRSYGCYKRNNLSNIYRIKTKRQFNLRIINLVLYVYSDLLRTTTTATSNCYQLPVIFSYIWPYSALKQCWKHVCSILWKTVC